MCEMSSQPAPADLRERLMLALRRTSAASVLHSQAVARHVGISPSDLECLDLILLSGPATAGQIGERTSLTSGAVTGLIDRLERQGFVERTADPGDRRKVLVRVREERLNELMALYEPMRAATYALLAEYTEEQLALIADFAKRASEIALARVGELSETSPVRSPKRPGNPGKSLITREITATGINPVS